MAWSAVGPCGPGTEWYNSAMPYAIDPEFDSILTLLPNGTIEDVTAARTMLESLADVATGTVDTSGLDIEDRTVPGYLGSPEVAVRIYWAHRAPEPSPVLLNIHGGGFVLGGIRTEHAASVQLASALGIVVVSVEYRLAPEHRFPAGLHDCYAALLWLQSDGASLGIDLTRVAVYGQSAGGGLAAGLALFSRDHDGPPICFQFLGIPELDDRLETHSMRTFTDTPLWNRPNAELSWGFYLGGTEDGDVCPYAAPARATDLDGLPPAYVTAMEFDPLRDEGVHYALALLGAGVSVELHTFPGTFHGSAIASTADVSRRMYREQLLVLARALGVTRPDLP
jgi:acetyl esterase